MATDLNFISWQRSKLFELATPAADGPPSTGRLTGRLHLTLTDTLGGQSQTGASAPFSFMSAADIAGLQPGVNRKMLPPAFSHDAETTKLVHVEFDDPELPWRYTPRTGSKLQPWIVLLVGPADQLRVEGGLVTFVADAVLIEHDLKDSHLWAHTQDDGHTPISRLISPAGSAPAAGLLPQTGYVAAIVPAFDSQGREMWTISNGQVTDRPFTGASKDPLPAFQSWRFWTGDAGDFETLAAALRVRPTGTVGTTQLRYARSATDIDVTLTVRGALTSLLPDGESDSDPNPLPGDLQAARDDLGLLKTSVSDVPVPGKAERTILSLPAYGRPWLADPDSATWGKTLNVDPRYRSLAGLGMWMGVETQEELMEAAVQQSGALQDAAHLVRQMAFGVEAAGSLWNRRLSKTPELRLRVMGPMLSRLLSDNGQSVLARVTDETSPLCPALFSSAAQRILRDGTTISRFSKEKQIDRARFLQIVNLWPPDPDRAPDGLPHSDTAAERLEVHRLEDLIYNHEGRLYEFFRDRIPGLQKSSDRVICLGKLDEAVSTVINPTSPDSPARRRLGKILGEQAPATLQPFELPLGLDFPTWQLVNKHAKEWLLPGAGTVPKDSILTLRTYPRFVDAFLMGINTQFLAEMRWRNLPVSKAVTPLRMFWAYIDYTSGKRTADIQPFSEWVKHPAADLGDPSHQNVEPGGTREDLVFLFRTDLFRRYPGTLVYLVKPRPSDNIDELLKQTPVLEHTAAGRPNRQFFGPVYGGTLAPDLVFFAFDIAPGELEKYWLVLDEPPAELRFRNDKPPDTLSSAAFAKSTIDQPTRVAINGQFLAQEAIDHSP